jgi:hypothetical protein
MNFHSCYGIMTVRHNVTTISHKPHSHIFSPPNRVACPATDLKTAIRFGFKKDTNQKGLHKAFFM